jgi:phosphoglucosamine mutase
MANFGLEQALAARGIGIVRAQVGDRYVLEEMRRLGANLGGEQSGHIIFLDDAPTGDGVLSALQLLRAVQESGQRLSELARVVAKAPQILVNVPVRSKPDLAGVPRVAALVGGWEGRLAGRGRILVRYSGTESLARVMVEGEEQAMIETAAREIAGAISAEIGGAA